MAMSQAKKISNDDLDALLCLVNQASNVLLIGNGGSNAIASHISVDYIKFLNKQSIAFSDPAMLTAFMNDEGVQNAYSEFISKMSNKDTLVILISSSGNSQNIFNILVSNDIISEEDKDDLISALTENVSRAQELGLPQLRKKHVERAKNGS